MFACLVGPLPDELICSWVARSMALNALSETREAMALIVGQRHARISVDLPGRLSLLGQRLLPAGTSTDAEGLLLRHTLFPYFRAFLPASRWPALRDGALSDASPTLKARLGVLAHGVGASPPWRSCPACDARSMSSWGTAYWHRSHHLPGVHVCPRHGVGLVERLRQARQGHPARLALPKTSTTTCAPLPQDGASPTHHHQLAKLSEQALRWSGPCVEPRMAREVYLGELGRREWTRRSGAPALEPLLAALRSRFEALPELAPGGRLAAHPDGRMPWVQGLLERRARFHAPLCHLLVVCVLFESWRHFMKRCAQLEENHVPVSDRAVESTRRAGATASPQASLGQAHNAGQPSRQPPPPVLDLKLSCRTAAARCDWDVHAIIAHRRANGLAVSSRPRRSQRSAKACLVAQLGRGLSVAQAARGSGLSLSTAYRALAERPDLRQDREESRKAEVLRRHRDAWLSLASAHPEWGPKRTRQAAPATFAWLYRNDRDWLQTHRPRGGPATRGPARVDWSQRDAELADSLEQRLRALRLSGSDELTHTQLVGLVLSSSSARKHAKELPLLMDAAKRLARKR